MSTGKGKGSAALIVMIWKLDQAEQLKHPKAEGRLVTLFLFF
jgi:hypothetical protein